MYILYKGLLTKDEKSMLQYTLDEILQTNVKIKFTL